MARRIQLDMSLDEARSVLIALNWRCNEYGLVDNNAKIMYMRLSKLIEDKPEHRRGKRYGKQSKAQS